MAAGVSSGRLPPLSSFVTLLPASNPLPGLSTGGSCATRFGPLASTCEYSAAGRSDFRGWRGAFGGLDSCLVSHRRHRRLFTSATHLAAPGGYVTLRSTAA